MWGENVQSPKQFYNPRIPVYGHQRMCLNFKISESWGSPAEEKFFRLFCCLCYCLLAFGENYMSTLGFDITKIHLKCLELGSGEMLHWEKELAPQAW